MKTIRNKFVLLAIVIAGLTTAYAQDPLPSWNDGATKKSITDFVAKVTKEGSSDFVPPEERIATFDNDGTLWCEQPMYFQLLFALDRVKTLAPQHPEWKTKEPFASLLKGDMKGALAGGEHAFMELVMATHAGMTTAEFEKIVTDWIATAKHPKFKRPYTECMYQQMVEWTQSGDGARFMLLVHHDDAAREYEYGAEGKIGIFTPALMDLATKNGWTVVSMKDDWKTVFAFEKQ